MQTTGVSTKVALQHIPCLRPQRPHLYRGCTTAELWHQRAPDISDKRTTELWEWPGFRSEIKTILGAVALSDL